MMQFTPPYYVFITKTFRFKPFFLLMVVINLFTISVYSQSPTPSNCNGAFDKTLTSSSSNCEFTSHIYDATSSEYWLFFTASNNEYDLQLKNINGNPLNTVVYPIS